MVDAVLLLFFERDWGFLNVSFAVYDNFRIYLGVWGKHVAQNDHVDVDNSIFVHELECLI